MEYPQTDISWVKERENGDGYEMETTFFGLYGVSSPLPGFYTEELFDDEWEDETSAKGFLDIIHYKLYPLLYQAWQKYRFNLNAIEHNDEHYWSILFSLIGLDKDVRHKIKNSGSLLKYAGILGMHPKSKMGLQQILSDMFKDIKISIEECTPRLIKIEAHQCCLLGQQNNQLGETSVLGEQIIDGMGQFSIKLGPVSQTQFNEIFNDKDLIKTIQSITHLFLVQPLLFNIDLTIERGEEENIALGNDSMLGQNSWVGVQENMPSYSVRLV